MEHHVYMCMCVNYGNAHMLKKHYQYLSARTSGKHT